MDHHVDLLNAASTGLADHPIIAAAVGVTLLALVLSIENYAELEGLEVSRLRAEIDIGSEALERGDLVEVDASRLQELIADLRKTGRKNTRQ